MNCPFKVGQIISRGDTAGTGIDSHRVINNYEVIAIEGPTLRLKWLSRPDVIIRVIWHEDGTTGD